MWLFNKNGDNDRYIEVVENETPIFKTGVGGLRIAVYDNCNLILNKKDEFKNVLKDDIKIKGTTNLTLNNIERTYIQLFVGSWKLCIVPADDIEILNSYIPIKNLDEKIDEINEKNNKTKEEMIEIQKNTEEKRLKYEKETIEKQGINEIKLLEKYNIENSEGIIALHEGYLDEVRRGIGGENKQSVKGLALLYHDCLVIHKKGVILGSNKGVKKLYFSNISSIDLDQPGKFHVTYGIDITMSGSHPIRFTYANKSLVGFFEKLEESYHKFKTNIQTNNTTSSSGTISDVEQLEKIIELYETGLLTDEEFIALKSKIIEN